MKRRTLLLLLLAGCAERCDNFEQNQCWAWISECAQHRPLEECKHDVRVIYDWCRP